MHSKLAARHVFFAIGIFIAGAVACGGGESSGETPGGGASSDMVCQPGATTSCYTGPAATRDVGACKAGVATCNTDGHGYGPCANEVVPSRELCNGGIDDDCDGTPEPSDCVACEQGTGSCNGNVATSCPDGLHLVTAECDALMGTTCNPTRGVCEGACADGSLGTGSLGCDFYPTVTANISEASQPFGVVVTNDAGDPVVVTISKGSNLIESRTIAGHAMVSIELPWVTALKGPDRESSSLVMPSVRVDQGGYRLRFTRPVTVHQFTPLMPDMSADASLLLPVNTWGTEYRVLARAQSSVGAGFYAITAAEDGTIVNVKAPPSGVVVKAGINGISTTGDGTVTINRGDVLEVLTDAPKEETNDLTGTLVTANKRIQVIGGHQCAFVPADVPYCDHLEETMWPVSMAASRYIVAGPTVASDPVPDQVVRILATEPDTKLTYEPAQAEGPTAIAQAGAWVEFRTSKEFEIRADHPVFVAQYQVGATGRGTSRGGDPSLTLALPVERYKTSYVINDVESFLNTIDVIAPLGAVIKLDDELIASLAPIGNTGFGVARKALSSPASRIHHITGTAPFGVDVYGYTGGASYWYPAELPSK